MTADDLPPLFNVTVPSHPREQLRAWAGQAARVGRRQECLLALRLMAEHLEFDPDEWGDPLFGYDHITAVEYRGMIPGWWLVWYGVDAAAKQVFVRSLLPAPGSPLTAEGEQA